MQHNDSKARHTNRSTTDEVHGTEVDDFKLQVGRHEEGPEILSGTWVVLSLSHESTKHVTFDRSSRRACEIPAKCRMVRKQYQNMLSFG